MGILGRTRWSAEQGVWTLRSRYRERRAVDPPRQQCPRSLRRILPYGRQVAGPRATGKRSRAGARTPGLRARRKLDSRVRARVPAPAARSRQPLSVHGASQPQARVGAQASRHSPSCRRRLRPRPARSRPPSTCSRRCPAPRAARSTAASASAAASSHWAAAGQLSARRAERAAGGARGGGAGRRGSGRLAALSARQEAAARRRGQGAKGDQSTPRGGALGGGAASPWQRRPAHLASLGVAGGRLRGLLKDSEDLKWS